MVEMAVESHQLSKRYGDTLAVAGLDLQVQTGTVLGFLGPNGAGKTTVIRMLSTILDPDGGSFSVAGVPGTDRDAVRERIGVLPESAGYPRQQTGREWLTYHGQLFGRSHDAARAAADDWLHEVGLAERGSALIDTYSRGMRQRLGIARALIHDPQVIFLDEPTLGLDPAGQRQILALVSRIAEQRGVTVVFSSHLLAEVEEICQRVLILNQGRVAAEGTVADVVRTAAAPRTAVVQVKGDAADRAVEVLTAAGFTVDRSDGRGAGAVVVELDAAEPSGVKTAQLLSALVDADVAVLGLEIEGGRLSDAFLTLTSPS